ncbi:MAG: hypothetical protein A2Y80_08930 [Deltaproteobacteria bacterium RBG_13_58_19]|nr:MAG: hypothetical protein A2Y80_08930 [Deltaproteobacteria bacterium RBG_13_58_19]
MPFAFDLRSDPRVHRLLVILVLASLTTGALQQIIGGMHGAWDLPQFSMSSFLLGLPWLVVALVLGWCAPVVLIYGVAFFTCFNAWRPIDLPIGSFTASQILSMLAIIIIILKYQPHSWGSNRRISRVMLILLAIMALSAIHVLFLDVGDTSGLPILREGRSNPLIRSLSAIGSVMIGMSAYFATVYLLKDPARLLSALKCWIGGALFTVLVGFYCLAHSYAPGLPAIPLPTLGGDGTGVITRDLFFTESFGSGPLVYRLASFAYEPRHLALMLSPLVCFLLVMGTLSHSTIGYNKKKYLFVTGIMLVGLALTTSRTTYIFYIVIIAIYLWSIRISKQQKYKSSLYLVIFALLIILGLYYIFYGMNPIDFIVSQLESFQEADVSQTGMPIAIAGLKIGWDMFINSPLLGQGIGSYIYFIDKYGYSFFLAPSPNNLYLSIMAETGIIGLIVILWLFIVGLRIARSIMPSASEMQHSLSLALAATLLVTYFDFILWDLIHYTNLWMLLGFVEAASKITGFPNSPLPSADMAIGIQEAPGTVGSCPIS